MKVADAKPGETVFLEEPFRDYGEVRETYYTIVDESAYRHHGCIQGAVELEEDERPRYINVSLEGYLYPRVNALVVKPLVESRFWRFVDAQPR